MQDHKAAVDQKIKQADKKKGLLVVITGDGKGKSSSGFGMVARALGHNMKVGVVQFIKGAFSTGEEKFFRRLCFHYSTVNPVLDIIFKPLNHYNSKQKFSLNSYLIQYKELDYNSINLKFYLSLFSINVPYCCFI